MEDMTEWIKWWKDKTFLLILGIAMLSMLVAGIFANCFSWGWVVSCVAACLGGFAIRKIVVKKLNELSENDKGEG